MILWINVALAITSLCLDLALVPTILSRRAHVHRASSALYMCTLTVTASCYFLLGLDYAACVVSVGAFEWLYLLVWRGLT